MTISLKNRSMLVLVLFVSLTILYDYTEGT